MKKYTNLILAVIVIFSFLNSSCKKQEGKGGKLSIKGKVYANYFNKSFTKQRGEGYHPEEDVYIIYGDEEFNGDDVKTNKDGVYEFNYLQKGKYTIYTYSTDLTTQKKVAIVKEVTISDDYTVEDFVVNKEDKSYGTFAIRGKVYVNDYDNSYTFQDGPSYYILDEDVYLIQDGDSSYSDKVSTNYNGLFEFQGLRDGKYKLYVYSEADNAIVPGGKEPIIKNVEITNGDLMLSDFVIIKN